MEALSKVFALIRHEGISKSLIGIFSTCYSAKKEIEREERRDVLFYIQERSIDSIDEPLYEIEIKYCVKGEKSEMIVTRNSIEVE